MSATVFDQGKVSGGRSSPAPSRMTELNLELKRTSVWFKMNSTTTDWIRTSMKAAVPLKQADSICFDLKKREIEYHCIQPEEWEGVRPLGKALAHVNCYASLHGQTRH